MTEADAELIIEQEARDIPKIDNPSADGFKFRSNTASADFGWASDADKSSFRTAVRQSLKALFSGDGKW